MHTYADGVGDSNRNGNGDSDINSCG